MSSLFQSQAARTQAANQPRARDGKFVCYLPEQPDLSDMPAFPEHDERRHVKQPHPAQFYLPGTPYRFEDEEFWQEDKTIESWEAESKFPIKPVKVGDEAYFEGSFTEMWEEMPYLWEALGELQGSKQEWSDVVSTVLASLASSGDLNLGRYNSYVLHDAREAVEGIRYAGAMLKWPGYFSSSPHKKRVSYFKYLEKISHEGWMETWRTTFSEYARIPPTDSYTIHNIGMYAQGAQLVLQKVAERLGHVHNVDKTPNECKSIKKVSRISAMPDFSVMSCLSLATYDRTWGNDGNGVLRYCADSESAYTAHIFEPNAATKLTWHPKRRGGYRHKRREYAQEFSLNGKSFSAFRDKDAEGSENCNWAEFALGRRTPPDCNSFEVPKVPLALYVMAKCEQGDPLREKAETFISEMGFEPIAAQHIFELLSNRPKNMEDFDAGVDLAEAWLEYSQDRDCSWYASEDDTPGKQVCYTPETLHRLAVERASHKEDPNSYYYVPFKGTPYELASS